MVFTCYISVYLANTVLRQRKSLIFLKHLYIIKNAILSIYIHLQLFFALQSIIKCTISVIKNCVLFSNFPWVVNMQLKKFAVFFQFAKMTAFMSLYKKWIKHRNNLQIFTAQAQCNFFDAIISNTMSKLR